MCRSSSTETRQAAMYFLSILSSWEWEDINEELVGKGVLGVVVECYERTGGKVSEKLGALVAMVVGNLATERRVAEGSPL